MRKVFVFNSLFSCEHFINFIIIVSEIALLYRYRVSRVMQLSIPILVGSTMVSKHGLPMTGLKEAAGETHYMDCGLCTGIYYNTDTGWIDADTQANCNTWVV